MDNNKTTDMNAIKDKIYYIVSFIAVVIVAILFTFPLYWIITGAFKTGKEINATSPIWIPTEWVWDNFQRLMAKRTAPILGWEIGGMTIGAATIPGAIRWLLNTVVMCVSSMLLTCITSAMAGYVLAKKRFWGRVTLFTLVVCAMALPKQVILIPLLREMNALHLADTAWAVIFPIVGWPFGVFLLKQFSEGVPTEMMEACRIDGANEWRTFTDVIFPMIKPGVGACAIFTFISAWNDYFMQLIMLTSSEKLSIAVGIATMQGESSTDYGLLMSGAALASVPIIIVFLIFQKYFTKGITMGAVKG
ncbi:MAG: carbohydrate ABC transporter permease [Lachnospiraceae bacterium]|nr:carbohydrate ABC transporter permease [Lachnospiraceae bacterium]